jgi:hypothetical protein
MMSMFRGEYGPVIPASKHMIAAASVIGTKPFV